MLPGFLAALASLAGPRAAWATIYNVKVCAQYAVNFTDASNDVGDDYFTSNSNKPARGASIRLYDLYNGDTVDWDFADDSGADVGCLGTYALDSTHTYSVRLHSYARVNGNYAYVYDDSSTPWIYAEYIANGWSPTSSDPLTRVSSAADQWMIAAAAGWALARSSVGLSAHVYKLYTEGCTGPGTGSCVSGGEAYIDASGTNAGADDKFVIVHEMGHIVARKKNGGLGADVNYDATPGVCYTDDNGNGYYDDRDHDIVQKEWQSAAASEGHANYWAAFAFNRTDQFDCGFQYALKVDWNLDGNTADDRKFSCESGPSSIYGVDNYDFTGDYCSPTGNQAVHLDWLRFLWDLTTDQGVGTTTIYNIWDDANPDSWTDSGSGWGSDYPATRLRTAADGNGVLDEWDDEDNLNGVHR